ncbi:MAG: hypothetical protein P8017_07290 [Deltaproteobacteria bacterium]
MRRLLESGIDFLIESGFLYLPLLFDPSVEKEVQTTLDTSSPRPARESLIKTDGKHFVRTLSLTSLVVNYGKINQRFYDQVRSTVVQKVPVKLDGGSTPFSWKLITIIFEIMPYFIRKNRGLERKKFGRQEILKLIAEKAGIPPRYYQRNNTFFDLRPLREALREFERLGSKFVLPEDGIISCSELNNWLKEALESQGW